jgi:hypothetical protein
LADEVGFAIHANRLADFPIYWQVLIGKFRRFGAVFGDFPAFLQTGTPRAKQEATSGTSGAKRRKRFTDMTFGLDKSDMQRMMVSALGALALSATCIGAAIGPAKAASPVTVASQIHQLAAK